MTMTSAQVERIEIDPQRLLVDLNIRLNANLNKSFVASIKELGVLQAITAVRTPSGDLRVRYGHRRTLAAIEAELTTVPVDVIGDEGTDDADQIERVIRQHAENAHRTALTSAEEVGVVEQLAAFGLSAGQIQRRIKVKRATVDHAIAISGSALAKAAADRYDFLTFEQAAAVAEFENDTEAVTALVAAAKSGSFAHCVQRLRDKRSDDEARAVVETALREAGVLLVDRPEWGAVTKRLSSVTQNGEPIEAADHAACAGNAAFIEEQWIESDDEEDRSEFVAVYVCTDPAANGHDIATNRHGKAQPTEPSPEQVEAARQERRSVLANNKAWRSAEAVRRDWLRALLKRKKAPQGAAACS